MICIIKFLFIFLGYTKGLTVHLQKRVKDICQAYSDVSSVMHALTELCGNDDGKHKRRFEKLW